MITEAINRILGLAAPSIVEHGSLKLTNQKLDFIKDPQPESLHVDTLSGLIGLLPFLGDGIYFHIDNYRQVSVLPTAIDAWGRRAVLARAEAPPETTTARFGQYLDHENFIIWLQSNFTAEGDRDYLVRIAGNLTADAVRTSQDDGISQTVATRKGVTLKTEETVRGRVKLSPFRTFREAKQPESEFVFRVKQTEGQVPLLALIEADGGAWKIAAGQSIALELGFQLGDKAAQYPVIR